VRRIGLPDKTNGELNARGNGVGWVTESTEFGIGERLVDTATREILYVQGRPIASRLGVGVDQLAEQLKPTLVEYVNWPGWPGIGA
jgi:hypothetical protein